MFRNPYTKNRPPMNPAKTTPKTDRLDMEGQAFGGDIATRNPFSAADYRRTTARAPAYTGPNASRSAFARGLADTTSAGTFSDMEDYQREYRQKAEQARMQDVQSRRENKTSLYQLAQQREVTNKQLDTYKKSKLLDLDAYMQRARKDSQAATVGNIAQLLLQGTYLAGPSAMQMARSGGRTLGNSARVGTLGLLGGLRGNLGGVTDTGRSSLFASMLD
jgi:hypothetical protein